jgi:hypothetical protein
LEILLSREKVSQKLRLLSREQKIKTYPRFLEILLSREKVSQELRLSEKGEEKELPTPGSWRSC